MIIEIKGVEFENKGAHLMLVAIAQQLRQWWPNGQFALTHSAKASHAQRSTVASFRKINLRKHLLDLNFISYLLPIWLRSLLKRYGLVTEADIDMIIDASGFSYSDQWPSKVRIFHLQNELQRFDRHIKPYIFMPQAFGPFTTQVSRKRIARSFKYAAMICARERQSFLHIEELTGSITSLFQFDDFTNLADGFVPDSFDPESEWACIVPNKNMINSRNTSQAWLQRYESVLIGAIAHYRERGLKPFFLNHEGVEDGELIAKINGVLVEPIPVMVEFDPLAVKGIIGASRAVLCSRYHGCISAMSQGIACIGTSWSHKYELLYQQYQADGLLLKPNITDAELRAVIDLSLQPDSKEALRIREQALVLKDKSTAMWSKFQSVTDRYPLFKTSRSQ